MSSPGTLWPALGRHGLSITSISVRSGNKILISSTLHCIVCSIIKHQNLWQEFCYYRYIQASCSYFKKKKLLQRLKSEIQNTVDWFQIPVFNDYMLAENSGHAGISSLIFAYIFQIIQDILTGNFSSWYRKSEIHSKSWSQKRTSWTVCKEVLRRHFKKLLN